MKEKIILRCGTIAFTLLFLFLVSTLAEEHEPFSDPYTFNPNDPASFDYVSGDYSMINDWSMVDWSQIPPGRIYEVPAEQLDYSQLNAAQRQEMTSAQIGANFDHIGDLTKDVNPAAAEKAIKETYNINVDLGKGARLHGGVLSSTFGREEHITITGAGQKMYSQGEVEVREDGSIIFIPDKSAKELTIPAADSLSVSAPQPITYKGHTIEGGLSFQQGQAYLKENDYVIVEGMYIGANPFFWGEEYTPYKNTLQIYFGTAVLPEGNYVQFAGDTIRIGSTADGQVFFWPQSGNRFFDMLKWEYAADKQRNLIPGASPRPVPDEKAFMQILANEGAQLEMKTRSAEGKTPLVHHTGGGNVYITNGRMELSATDKHFWLTPPEPFPRDLHEEMNLVNSVAFEFTSDAPLMAGAVMRTSSSNRWQYMKDGSIVSGSDLGLLVSDSREVNMMKTEADLQAKYPEIAFERAPSPEVPVLPEYYNGITANMAQAVDQWLKDKPGISPPLERITFHTGVRPFASDRRIELSERHMETGAGDDHPAYPNMPMDGVDHEFGHVMDFYVERQDPRHHGLLELYDAEAQRLGMQLAANKEYHEFTERLDQKIPLIDLPAVVRNLPFESAAEGVPEDIYKVAKGFDFGKLPKTYGLYRQYLAHITRETGLTAYAFSKPREAQHYFELPAEYGTLPISLARRQPRLAQLEFDRVNSLDIADRNEPRYQWLYQPAEERYWAIVGGPDSPYCQQHGCGACKLYTATCLAPR